MLSYICLHTHDITYALIHALAKVINCYPLVLGLGTGQGDKGRRTRTHLLVHHHHAFTMDVVEVKYEPPVEVPFSIHRAIMDISFLSSILTLHPSGGVREGMGGCEGGREGQGKV